MPFVLHPLLVAALVSAAAGLGALVLVDGVRRYALRRNVLDVPSARSSHRVPTPRGGGLGVVLAVALVGVPAATWAGYPLPVTVAAALAVAAVAVVGWLDDHRSLRVRTRLVVHVGAGVLVAVLAGAAGVLPADGALGVPGRLLVAGWWVFWTVSAINVVNFMDGIDGIIGAQLAVYGAYVAAAAPAGSAAFVLGLTVAAAALGFLRWNWSPAAIFLGDVGSGPAGVLVVLLGLALVHAGERSMVRACLPLFPLFLDAAVTLVRRARAGERLTTPHRSHLYQRLANGPWGHARTALAYAALAAVGALAGLLPVTRWGVGVVLAYAALVVGVGLRLDALVPWRERPAERR